MILSVSRRTDIPNYYSEWFLNRIREGFLYVRNPMNPRQISRIDLSPETTDCIVFWTKNPAPMLDRLEELKDYAYYFQFTLTGYGRDVEPNLPDKRKVLIPVFRALSEKIGKEKVIWRYDPIFVNSRYTLEYHRKAFEEIADSLAGYTEKAVISFVDFYARTERSLREFDVRKLTEEEMVELAARMAETASRYGMTAESCAEQTDFQKAGVPHGSCIDRRLIEKITGCRISAGKDKGQRPACGCLESVEVGAYDTCLNGCKYCYANENNRIVKEKVRFYQPDSPLLCGTPGPEDKITVRKMKSLKDAQISFFLQDVIE